MIAFSGAATATCPATFGAFIKHFEFERTFQEQHIRYPVPYSSQDGNCTSDCRAIKQLSKSDVVRNQNALFPLAETQRMDGLVQEQSVLESRAKVEVFLPDSDAYIMLFTFSRTKSCWQLTSVEDLSPP